MEHLDACRWRKSSYSGNGGADCVEIAADVGVGRVLVRDTKNPGGPVLRFTPDTWRSFARTLRAAVRSSSSRS
jgi:hypothetical protein